MSDDIFNIKDDRITSYVCFIFANSCMPTLTKAKPSTLVSFHKKYIDDKFRFYMILKQEALPFNCHYKLLCESDTVFYILIYNLNMLQDIFTRYGGDSVLKMAGYRTEKELFYRNLCHFKRRYGMFQMKHTENFPHEVGILLGYPVKDVEAYIENNGENFLICGYWKVYYDVEEAGRIFEYFRTLRKEAIELIFSGKELKEILSCA